METNKIGLRIKERRIALNMTQADLQKKMGYRNRSTISRIEKGLADIPQVKVEKFAIALDTTVEYLMGIENPAKEYVDTILKDLTDVDLVLEKNLIEYFRKLNVAGKMKRHNASERWRRSRVGRTRKKAHKWRIKQIAHAEIRIILGFGVRRE